MGFVAFKERERTPLLLPVDTNFPVAMTPSLSLLLFVALFWTLPATTAVLAYRRHDSSVEKLMDSIRRSVEPMLSTPRTEEVKA
jgi:hypothetical protein